MKVVVERFNFAKGTVTKVEREVDVRKSMAGNAFLQLMKHKVHACPDFVSIQAQQRCQEGQQRIIRAVDEMTKQGRASFEALQEFYGEMGIQVERAKNG